MGVEISKTSFNQEDEQNFMQCLRQETKILKKWFDGKQFEEISTPRCGLEVEAWLSKSDFTPSPTCESFIQHINDKNIVPEISKFNFELNSPVLNVEGKVISKIHHHLKTVWKKCQEVAKKQNELAFMIGSLPTLTDEMLSLDNLYPNKRYFALNDQILKLRKDIPIEIDIEGQEHLKVSHKDVMLEAAATSVQFHFQIPFSETVQYYNASLLASPFMAVLGANSPFLFGKKLWSESRIAIFEQSICLESYPRLSGRMARRVSLGSGYIKNSLLELFIENLDGFPALLPLCYEEAPEEMKHLNLHNGTIWRWNRPIVGIDEKGNKSLRIEHRVPSSGPSPTDITANMFAYIGITSYIKKRYPQFTESISFERLRATFYEACKEGYSTRCTWLNGERFNLQEILLDDLLPGAKQSLLDMQIEAKEVSWIFDDILIPRVEQQSNGAAWQSKFIDTHGKRFPEMLEIYYRNQSNDLPIHKWEV